MQGASIGIFMPTMHSALRCMNTFSRASTAVYCASTKPPNIVVCVAHSRRFAKPKLAIPRRFTGSTKHRVSASSESGKSSQNYITAPHKDPIKDREEAKRHCLCFSVSCRHMRHSYARGLHVFVSFGYVSTAYLCRPVACTVGNIMVEATSPARCQECAHARFSGGE